jgi:hypothetical protein
MKTPEDEAFDDLARRQGMWGGGYQAKRAMAADKINADFDEAYKKMHEDRAMDGTSWSKDGERIDPASVYLEQPAQEPVAWGFRSSDGAIYDCIPSESHDDYEGSYNVPLYTTSPKRQWIWLSDADIRETIDSICQYTGDYDEFLCKEIEAKLKEKNT